MGIFRTVGKSLGELGGTVIGGGVKLAGKAVGTKHKGVGDWIEEVGDSVKVASKVALDNAGQFVDGAVEGTYGLIKKDEYYKQKGLENIKDSAGRTVKGLGSTLKYTLSNAGEVYMAANFTGDKEKAVEGLKNLGKVVAVSALAIGVVDIVDGADVAEAEEIDTRNEHLNGTEHPDTGVLFVEKTVQLPNGDVQEGTFPVFESEFNVVLSEELYTQSDAVHFNVANDTLYQAIQNDPNIIQEIGLSQADVISLEYGQTPEGYTWHHNEEPGLLQLVDEEVHEQTGHTGGRTIWGGGTEHR